MKGDLHVRFLGGGIVVRRSRYPSVSDYLDMITIGGSDRGFLLPMETGVDDVEPCHVLLGHFEVCHIAATVETALDLQALGGSAGDQADGGLVIPEGLAAPVRGDEREQPVFDLVPFARARREAADRNLQVGFIGQVLQFAFPPREKHLVGSAPWNLLRGPIYIGL